ncbi:protein-disulfide reductase DsbD family protein [Parasphingopyxis marina]|uniref:Thioredoxin family protein n=1 Tax=Parasphingopyxis marina TaxID=2761622 RepID=A0A842I0N0_9SPHN|nr:thioredoxin family protein [Parasphingopyxis marina]
MKNFGSLIALFVAALWLFPASAQIRDQNAIAATLIAETQTPAPGASFTIAIRMRPDPGWHGYWRNPGDAGLPGRFAWTLPEGVTIGELRYPVPERLTISGIMNYVYEGEYALLAEVMLDEDIAPGTEIPLRAEGDWLACTDEICVPERGTLSLDLVAGSGEATDTADFDRFRARLPRPLDSEGRFALAGETLRLAIPFPETAAIADPYFFPATERALDYGALQGISRDGDWLIVEVAAGAGAAGIERIEGVLKIGAHDGLMVALVPGDVPAAGVPIAGEPMNSSVIRADAETVLLALAGAILGGLLLNIMPCVFPILSLKALSLARAGGEERAARRDALAYAVGVVLTCVALGAALLILRAGGAQLGWAFQLQDPRMILALLLLVSAITLNLVGLFELPGLTAGGNLAGKEGAAGSFFTGALAAFVATPCTGPFMAGALGAALVLPSVVALAIFAGLGLGLALPFLALAYIPALRNRLPRPGPWLVRFRHIMAIPMGLTALALGWVLWRQTGASGLFLGLAVALILAVLLWWAGRQQRAGRNAWLPILPVAALTVGAIAVLPVPVATANAESGVLGAEPFSETRLAELRGEGRPVFVYFTADWCITCKANEAGALARTAVAEHFEANDIAVLVGDWTTGDAGIGRFLEEQGRSGVPLYLYYAPGEEAQILPQILTVGELTAL